MSGMSTARTAVAVAAPESGLRAAVRRVWDKLNVEAPVPARRMPTGRAALAAQANGLLRSPQAIWPTSL